MFAPAPARIALMRARKVPVPLHSAITESNRAALASNLSPPPTPHPGTKRGVLTPKPRPAANKNTRAAEPGNRVPARPADEDVAAGRADQRVIAGSADDDVAAEIARGVDGVIARAAQDNG